MGWNFARVCASRSGVPSGAERSVDDVMASLPASFKIATQTLPICGVPHCFCYGCGIFRFLESSPCLGTSFFWDVPLELRISSRYS